MVRKRPNQGAGTPPFAQVVSEVKARTDVDELDGRSRSRFLGTELWDEQGLHWTLIGPLGRDEATQMLTRPGVRLGVVWQGNRTIEWISETAKGSVWSVRILPGLVEPGERNSTGEMFSPQEWSRVGGSRLLIVQKYC